MSELLHEIADLGAPEGSSEQFQITDLGGASWAMRKLAAIRRRQDEVRRVADSEVTRIQDWAATQVRSLDQDGAYFESLLTDYHRRLVAEDPKAKTISLPHGALKCRAQQPEYIRDEDELLAWAEAADPEALVEVKKSPRWAEIKKRGKPSGQHLIDQDTGEVIAGVLVVPREPKFTVDVEVE